MYDFAITYANIIFLISPSDDAGGGGGGGGTTVDVLCSPGCPESMRCRTLRPQEPEDQPYTKDMATRGDTDAIMRQANRGDGRCPIQHFENRMI